MGQQQTRQLALSIQLKDQATIANFHWGQHALLQQYLQFAVQGHGERMIYLWGLPGSGKSHILQACCNAMPPPQSAMYLPLMQLHTFGPALLDGMDEQPLIALDDINAIAGDPLWEESLFHLYNRVRDGGKTTLVISGNSAPSNINLNLPDLRTRLNCGLVFQLHELDDDAKIKTLQQHAKKRGIDLTKTVGHFLLNRCARNMHDLHAILDRLDQASLAAHRKITIPFVKTVLQL